MLLTSSTAAIYDFNRYNAENDKNDVAEQMEGITIEDVEMETSDGAGDFNIISKAGFCHLGLQPTAAFYPSIDSQSNYVMLKDSNDPQVNSVQHFPRHIKPRMATPNSKATNHLRKDSRIDLTRKTPVKQFQNSMRDFFKT